MREWELDPLFAAAEVVQDSADRMDSVFRLLFHEQSLASGDQMDKQLLSSIEYHKRDLATALETAKWQLEDFEREVKFSARADKSMLKQNVIRRHMQFIGAIRGQITQLEQNMNSSAENLLRNVNLNEEDRDGFALFLLGKEPIKHMVDEEPEDNAILGRRLGPDMSSSSKEDFDKKKAGQIASLIADEIQYLDRNLELKIFQTVMDLGPSVSFEEANINNGGYGEEGNWDLEANHANGRSYLQKNNLRGYFGRTNIFESLGTFLSTHKRRFSRSLTKRFKDGEELTQYPSFDNIHRGMQQPNSWIRDCREKFQRSLHRIQARYHPVPSILALLLTLLILFSGLVTDEKVERGESIPRRLLNNSPDFCVKEGVSLWKLHRL